MREHSLLIFATVALGVMYGGLILALPPGSLALPEEGIRWLQIDSLWRHRWTSLAIDPPGGDLDPDGEFAPSALARTPDGLRARVPALFPLVATLLYVPFGTRGAWLLPALFAILCMAAATRLGRRVAPGGWAALAGVTAVAASPLLVQGAMLREETLGALLGIAALIPICRGEGGAQRGTGPPGARRLLASGILMGLAATACPPCAALIPAAILSGIIVWGARGFGAGVAALTAGAAAILAPLTIVRPDLLGGLPSPGPGTGADLLVAVALGGLVLSVELIPGLPPDPRRRFLVWCAAVWMAGSPLFSGSTGLGGWARAGLAPAACALVIALFASVGARRGLRGGSVAIALLGLVLAVGFAAQAAALRRLVGVRTYNAMVLERVRAGLPERGVILSDRPEVLPLLATLGPAIPSLYAPRGSDLESLSARLEAAGRSPVWIVRTRSKHRAGRGPATMEAAAGYTRGEELEIGGDLVMLRYEHQPGVRGFMRTPPGD